MLDACRRRRAATWARSPCADLSFRDASRSWSSDGWSVELPILLSPTDSRSPEVSAGVSKEPVAILADARQRGSACFGVSRARRASMCRFPPRAEIRLGLCQQPPSPHYLGTPQLWLLRRASLSPASSRAPPDRPPVVRAARRGLASPMPWATPERLCARSPSGAPRRSAYDPCPTRARFRCRRCRRRGRRMAGTSSSARARPWRGRSRSSTRAPQESALLGHHERHRVPAGHSTERRSRTCI